MAGSEAKARAVIQSEPRGWGRRDTYNLTLSVDRPTFINFLNPKEFTHKNGKLTGVTFTKMHWVEKDGKRKLEPTGPEGRTTLPRRKRSRA